MRNLHLIPTDVIGKIFYIAENFHLEKGQLIEPKSYHNIYITSDEEIKEVCYVISTYDNWRGDGKLKPQVGKILEIHDDYYLIDSFNGDIDNRWEKGHSKKIILTTDQDLIADGVQAIDDEFLEWFVKNPSCEEVEVQKWFDGIDFLEYKIIIPKEEPKKETISFEFFDKEKDDSITNEGQKIVRELQNITKQETLEEVSFRLYPRLINDPYNPMEDDNKEDRDTWIEGAKWGSENTNKKYNEEEVIELLIFCKNIFGGSGLEDYTPDSEVKEWFEQFKKK
jgi:hypothetical protein